MSELKDEKPETDTNAGADAVQGTVADADVAADVTTYDKNDEKKSSKKSD